MSEPMCNEEKKESRSLQQSDNTEPAASSYKPIVDSRAKKKKRTKKYFSSSFLFYSVLRRVPGYSFVLLHLCFLHALWGELMERAALFDAGEVPLPALVVQWAAQVPVALTTTLRTHLLRGGAEVYRLQQAQPQFRESNVALRLFSFLWAFVVHLWATPSAMMLCFGIVFVCASVALFAGRVVKAMLWYFTRPCQPRWLEEGGSQRPIPLWITLRYGNGYDRLFRVCLAVSELLWFFSYPLSISWDRRYSGAAMAGGTSGAGGGDISGAAGRRGGGNGANPSYATMRQHQARQQSILSFQMEASQLLPPALFATTADALAAAPVVVLVVKCILALSVTLDVQRLFNALVGVRDLHIPDGWDRCPVCGALWKLSTRGKHVLHRCPVLLWKPPAEAEESSSPVKETLRAPDAEPVYRPGDAFPDPNCVSWWSSLTYSWLNPLMNFSLLAPFASFTAPSPAKYPSGKGYWQAQLDVVARLPRLPEAFRMEERIDGEAWRLWSRQSVRGSGSPEAKEFAGWEGMLLRCTAPFRPLLVRAFALFYLPPPPADDAMEMVEAPRPRRGRRLFDVFLRHPSGREFVFGCVPFKLVQDIAASTAPGVVGVLVRFLKEVGRANAKDRLSYLPKGVAICAALLLVTLVQAVFFQGYITRLYDSSLKTTSAIKALLLRETLATPLAYTGGNGGKKGRADGTSSTAAASPVGSPMSRKDKARTGHGRDSSPLSSPASLGSSLSASALEKTKSSAAPVVSREGEVVSLLTVDAANCGDCLIFLHNAWGHPLIILYSLVSMSSYVGWFSTVVTFGVLVALVPFNHRSATAARMAQQQAKSNGSRLSDLTASLTAMRTVKSMALEDCLRARIAESRALETEGEMMVGDAESAGVFKTELTTLIVALVCCGSYLLTGGKMDATVLVPTMAALNVMRFPVWTFPQLFSQVARGYNSLLRLEAYLAERDENFALGQVTNAHRPPSLAAAAVVPTGAIACAGSSFAWSARAAAEAAEENEAAAWNGTFTLPPAPRNGSDTSSTSRAGSPMDTAFSLEASGKGRSDSPSESLEGSTQLGLRRPAVLRDISLRVEPGDFVVVQGPTGAGKSALLLAMLGELHPMWPEEEAAAPMAPSPSPPGPAASPPPTPIRTRQPSATRPASPSSGGELREEWLGFRVGGTVSYCAEIPWLRQGTVRENIRMVADEVAESEEERAWYAKVLEACALTRDLRSLAEGDRTMVGEGGNKLSGGQRARVALARAAYRHDADVLLFDDVLSALDVEVQKHIIAHLFHGILGREGGSGRRRRTVVFATHVAAHMVMADRVFHLWSNGTLHEDATQTKPTAEQVERRKAGWRQATEAATEAKDLRRSLRLDGGVGARLAEEEEEASRGTEKGKVENADHRAGEGEAEEAEEERYSLFPRPADLQRLFVHFVGMRHIIFFILLCAVVQAFRTCMDSWLGLYLSLYERRQAAYETILRTTKSHRVRRFMVDLLSLVVYSNKTSTSEATVVPPAPEAMTLTAFVDMVRHQPISAWRNPLVSDTMILQFLGSYAAIGLAGAILSMTRTRFFYRYYRRMADGLQLHVVGKLFAAPASYFDRVPSSRLLQILSSGQEVVDHPLSESVQLILFTVLQLASLVLFNTMQYGAFIVVMPLSALLFYQLTLRFLRFTKQVRTLESTLQGRTVNVVKDCVKGAVSIRSMGDSVAQRMRDELNEALDAVHTTCSASFTADHWVALRLECVSLVVTTTLSVLSVVTACLSSSTTDGGAAVAGLGVVSCLGASKWFSLLCRRIGMFQTQFVSAEQLLRLEDEIPVEEDPPAGAAERATEGGESAVCAAVAQGPPLLEVRRLWGKYQPHLPWALKNICFAVRPGECVGLIGRTGNGKSSIFNALLGLMDVLEGEVIISSPCGGTVATADAIAMSRRHIRKNFFQLVSQEPFLLQGTCRSNLLLGLDSDGGGLDGDDDAAARQMDGRLWEVLQKVSLEELLAPPAWPSSPLLSHSSPLTAGKGGAAEAAKRENLMDYVLGHLVSAGGANLSAGQRQLLCLARAILHRPRVILLDEVSSRVDPRTDSVIQKVIKEEMLRRCELRGDNAENSSACGVLLIAHRLETILSLCDRVLVIEQGRCVADLSTDEVKGLEDLESYL